MARLANSLEKCFRKSFCKLRIPTGPYGNIYNLAQSTVIATEFMYEQLKKIDMMSLLHTSVTKRLCKIVV